jgi:hypothetical protein
MPGKIMCLAFGRLIGVVLGVGGTYCTLHHRNGKWIELKKDGDGLGYKSEAIFVDIPMPDMSSPTGQVKFVDRGLEKGTELGFIVKTTMKKLDTDKLPAKYKKTEQHGEYTIDPIDVVTYSSHIEFTLKDVDGFTLMTTKSEPVTVWSGKDSTFQGVAVDQVPEHGVVRTKMIQMSLVTDKCEICEP